MTLRRFGSTKYKLPTAKIRLIWREEKTLCWCPRYYNQHTGTNLTYNSLPYPVKEKWKHCKTYITSHYAIHNTFTFEVNAPLFWPLLRNCVISSLCYNQNCRNYEWDANYQWTYFLGLCNFFVNIQYHVLILFTVNGLCYYQVKPATPWIKYSQMSFCHFDHLTCCLLLAQCYARCSAISCGRTGKKYGFCFISVRQVFKQTTFVTITHVHL